MYYILLIYKQIYNIKLRQKTKFFQFFINSRKCKLEFNQLENKK